MSRLKTGMSMTEVIHSMAGPNQGAFLAMQHILAADSGRQIVSLLDHYKIYRADLYVVYNDKCQGLVRKLHTLLMATHMKLLSERDLRRLVTDHNQKIHFTEKQCEHFETAMRKAHEQTQKTKKHTPYR